MPITIKKIPARWVNAETGEDIQDYDKKLYDISCWLCGIHPECGVARAHGKFMCLGCLDEMETEHH